MVTSPKSCSRLARLRRRQSIGYIDGLAAAVRPAPSAHRCFDVEPTDAAAASFTTTTDPIATSTSTAPATDTRSLSSSGSSEQRNHLLPRQGRVCIPRVVRLRATLCPKPRRMKKTPTRTPSAATLSSPFATAVHPGEPMTFIFAVIEIQLRCRLRHHHRLRPERSLSSSRSMLHESRGDAGGTHSGEDDRRGTRRPAGARGPSAPRLPIPRP